MVSSQSQYNTTLSLIIFLDTTWGRKCCKSWKIEKLIRHGKTDVLAAVKPTHDYFSDPNFFADINELLTGLVVVGRGGGGMGGFAWAIACMFLEFMDKLQDDLHGPLPAGQGCFKTH